MSEMTVGRITFTPGPWQQRTLLVEYATHNLIAHCTWWDGHTPLPEVAEANARLIAAAPDLLAACKRIVENLSEDISDSVAEAWNEARLAIAKAEGR